MSAKTFRIFVYTKNTESVCVRTFYEDGAINSEIFGNYPKKDRESVIKDLQGQYGEENITIL